MLTIIDYIIAPTGWLLGNIIFNNFEKHLPIYRRTVKFILTVEILYIIGNFFGRITFYSILSTMGVGMIILHAWWFPKNGINGITAKPYYRYLKLIDNMKGSRSL